MGNKESSAAGNGAAGGNASRQASFLELKEIKRLIGMLSQSGALEIELEDQGSRLRIRMPEPQGRTEFVQVQSPYAPFVGAPQAGPDAAAPSATPESSADAGGLPEGTVYLNSPMVGTFYRAPSPDADPFASPGDKVKADSTVCILEAMKVMNEIKAEHEGEVVRFMVENGEPVEFGQPLMIIKVR